jgi:radical SAM superfamily enzyme YgiQ (UPF0313 family)
LPLREGLPLDQYKFPLFYSQPLSKMRTLSLQASRGCPYKCSFCQTPVVWGNRWVNKNAVAAVDEVEYLVDTYDVNTIWFRDEEFTIQPKWVMKICKEIMKRGLHKRITWGSFARVDDMSDEWAHCLSDAGYVYGFMGVESGTPNTREKMNKNFKQIEAEKALELFDKYDITSQIGWIIGLPWDTRESIEESFKWLLTLKADFVYFTFVTPFASTALRQQVEEQGLLISDNPDDLSTNKPTIRVPGIPYEELLKIPGELTKRYYLRPQYVMRTARRLLRQPKRIRITAEILREAVLPYWVAKREGKAVLANRAQAGPFIIPDKFCKPA